MQTMEFKFVIPEVVRFIRTGIKLFYQKVSVLQSLYLLFQILAFENKIQHLKILFGNVIQFSAI